MAHPSSPNDEPSVLDLFAGSDVPGTGRRSTARAIDAELDRHLRARAQASGWQADTLFAAAWMLAQSRWLGIEAPTLDEGPQRGAFALSCSPSRALGPWLAAFDAQRQAARAPTPGASSSIVWGVADPVGREAPTLCIRAQKEPSPQLVLEREAGLVDDATATELLEAVSAAAERLLHAGHDTLLGDIEVLSPSQRNRLVHQWNQPPTRNDPARTVVSRFEEQLARAPEAPAVAGGGDHLSYRQLGQRSDALAARLLALDVKPGEVVGVALDRSPTAIVALLAVLKAGAAYLPLQANLPEDRLAFMVQDAGVRVVVTNARRRGQLPAGVAVVLADAPVSEAAAGPALAPAIDGRSIAYVIYTSGSTGLPKGTEIRHQSILRLVVDADYVKLSNRSVVMHSVPLGFDVSTAEIWGALLNGGCCAVHDEDMPTGPGLARTIRAHGVTTVFTTAALFNTVIDGDPQNLAGLEQIFVGGEAISVPHVRRALAALPGLDVVNAYGPTECTTIATAYPVPGDLAADAVTLPIGRPIADTTAWVMSPTLALLPPGMVGELCLGGCGVARGYVNRPELTQDRFVPDPFEPGGSIYRTGDRARLLADGSIDFLGRQDGQVKVRGHRIEIGEIEAALMAHAGILAGCVMARKDATGDTRLVAYLVAARDDVLWDEVRADLSARLPEVMVPTGHVWLPALPLTANGKVDRRALPVLAAQRPELAQPYEEPRNPAETRVCAAFAQALGIDRAGRNDNFFELGGDSLRVLKVLAALQKDASFTLTPQLFFGAPTPQALAAALAGGPTLGDPARRTPRRRRERGAQDMPIAVIAMAGRFPGAADIEALWDVLCAGRDTIRRFADAELSPWVSPALRADPAYVPARGVLVDVDRFDAAFFGINPKEAEVMDPQQRVFLELCWECMERAGYAPDASSGPVGVYAGMNNGTYLQRHLLPRAGLLEDAGDVMVTVANEKDYIATRVAHRLNLTGPAISVHTACSTSLVAIAQAFHALRAGQCDMALAGGVSITCPPDSGYLYQEGAMLSPDGHTRTFDARAQGTVFSDGAAVVLLKPLDQALADGDPVCAVLRGAAVNNDGGHKASFTAPSAEGQAAVIAAALDDAGVDARSISYVEAHGTATPMGDPIEIEGLARAYARHTADIGFCAIGSLKSNVGHMVAAAGAGGLIKTALALEAGQIPPTAHFEQANAAIDFDATPFRVAASLLDWPRGAAPRRAGVSSFGVGGTNAHVIVEEAPPIAPSDPDPRPQVLMLSARSPAALEAAAQRLADHLEAHPGASMPDVAYTLRVGRKTFAQRLCVVARTPAEAVAALRADDSPLRATGAAAAWKSDPVLVFPGQGAQYAGMGQGLYADEPVFQSALDEALRAFEGTLDADLRERMFSPDTAALTPTSLTQPATFALEYAVARQVMSLGLEPAALIGHSVGEFAAAVLAGVLRLEDAARLVARRGALMQALPAGVMLTVRMSAADLAPRLPTGVSLAAENGPVACVAAGPLQAIESLRSALEADGIAARTLHTSHAFHSSMMDPAVQLFEDLVRQVRLSRPQIPIYSTLTGRLLTDAEATDPAYWARHLRETVQFSAAVRSALAAFAHPVFIEAGPRNTLTTLVRQHGSAQRATPAVALLGDAPASESASLRLAAGRLWAGGIDVDLARLGGRTRRLRLRLPTYPFERKRFWIDPVPYAAGPSDAPTSGTPSHPTPAAPTEPTMTAAPLSLPAAPARRTNLIARLRTVFEDISGVEMSGFEGRTPFVEMGLDSLTLTQVATQVKKHFKVNLSFRQLMESYRSFDALGEFLDTTLPPDPAAQAATVAPAPSAAAATQHLPVPPVPAAIAIAMPAVGGTLVQQVIAQQMQLMQQQLALLSGASAQAHAPSSAPAMRTEPTPAASEPSPVVTSPEPPEDRAPVKYDVKKAFGAIARIHTQNKEPTERQRARLAAFIRRYNERTPKSKSFTQTHRAHMADPRVVNGFRPATKEIVYQLVVERSKGSRVWDIDGNEYVDVLSGFGMNLFGWQPEFVQDAVRRQLELGYEIGPQHPLAADVTRLICDLTGFDRAALCNTGSEAVMAAIRIARTVTGRNTVVLFTGSYHGTFDEVLVRAGRNARGMSAAPGVLPGMFGDVRVLDYGTPEALEFIRANADDLAAVLVEPVQSRRPDFQPREFLREVRAITEKSDTCLIFDEVITGFRAHLGGAQAVYGIRADLACYGKVIGGGFPVGVIAGKRDFMDALDGGAWQYGDGSAPTVGVTYFAGTFVRHPLALAACKASLEHLQQAGEGLQTQLNLHTAAMADELSAFCREVGAPLEIRYFASLWRVTWLEDHPLQDLLFAMMRSRGVHILDNFPCFMTTAHTQQDIATIKSAFKESVAEMQEAEFLPRRAAPVQRFDAAHPPVPNARLGRDKDGQPAWFVPDPAAQGKFLKIQP